MGPRPGSTRWPPTFGWAATCLVAALSLSEPVLAQDPTRFEFERAWRQKVEQIRETRAALEAREGPFLTAGELEAQRAAVTGTLNVPVVGALYADQPSALFTASQYWDVLFGTANPQAAPYTVRTFYREMSRNVFEVGGAVPTWARLPEPASYYRPSAATNATFGRVGDFLKHSLDSLDTRINFAEFDNDGPDGIPNSGDDDGYVDVVAFLYQDAAMSCGGPGIWPHRWQYRGWWGSDYVTNDVSANGGFIRVSDYMIQSGVACDGASMMEIGTFSHELGHALGLPDLYDTDSSNGASEGVGHWDLMGSGNWNRPASPAHMGAWSKDFLGWVSVLPVTSSQTGVTLPEIKTTGDVLRYNLPGTREHFLMEHRAATGSDKYLSGPGLLVWHVDQEVIDSTRARNRVNADATRQGVALKQADGLFHLENRVNRGDAGDPFPGSSGKTVFGPATVPSTRNNAGGLSGLALEGISLQSGTLSFNLALAHELFASVPATMVLAPGEVGFDTLAVGTLDGHPVGVRASEGASWLTIAPDTAQTPVMMVLRYDAAGLAPGTYQDTIFLQSSQVGLSPLKRAVQLQVVANQLALGDSAKGTLGTAARVDTFWVQIAAGERVDVALHGQGSPALFYPLVRLFGPGGELLGGATGNYDMGSGHLATLSAVQAPTAGSYRIEVASACSWCTTSGYSGGYTVRVRRSGAVLGFWGLYLRKNLRAPFGASSVTDTIWVYNRGNAAGNLSVVSTHPSVTVAFGAATVAPMDPEFQALPVPLASGRVTGVVGGDEDREETRVPEPGTVAPSAPPSGSLPVLVTLDLAGAVESDFFLSNVLRFDGSVAWPVPSYVDVQAFVHDPQLTVVAAGLPAVTYGMAREPDGVLVVSADSGLWRVNPTTTEKARWATLGAGFDCLRGVAVGPDGSAYVGDVCAGALRKVTSAGVASVLASGLPTPLGVTMAPDGTVYVAEFASGLWRVDATTGAMTHLADVGTGHRAVAYDPESRGVFFTAENQVHRYDPATSAVTPVATLSGSVYDLQKGASGRWYVKHFSGVHTYSSGFVEVDRAIGTFYGYSLALEPGGVLGSTYGARDGYYGPHGSVYRIPVSDGPAVPTADSIRVWVRDAAAFPGDTAYVTVHVDLSEVGGALGSFEARLTWDTAVARYSDIHPAAFQGNFTANTDSASAGVLRFAGINTDASANRDTTLVALVRLIAAPHGGDSTALWLSVPSMARTTLDDVTSLLSVRSGVLRVVTGRWGDANRDQNITALDALICLSHVVGKDVSQFDATACDVAPDDGEAFTGRVTAMDALGVLSHVVGKVLPVTFRVGRGR